MRTDVLGVGFDNIAPEDAVKRAEELVAARKASYIVTPNPEIIMMCSEDDRLLAAVNGADLVLADGIGVIIGARILGDPLSRRIPGIDFAEALIRRLSENSCGLFLLGARPKVAESAAEELKKRYGGVRICGSCDGYFSDDGAIKEKINETKPDMILVCLGAPKQELWMSENAGRLDAGIMIGLGGALDVFSGNVKRAPEGWRRLGLEWLYRLIGEPRRIKRAVKLPLFIFRVIAVRLRGKKDAR